MRAEQNKLFVFYTETEYLGYLLSQEAGVKVPLEGFAIHVADRQVGVAIHDDAVLVDFGDVVKIDDVGAVNTHEIGRQPLFHAFHGEQGDDRLGFAIEVDLEVLAHSLDVADVRNGDLDNTVLGLEEE